MPRIALESTIKTGYRRLGIPLTPQNVPKIGEYVCRVRAQSESRSVTLPRVGQLTYRELKVTPLKMNIWIIRAQSHGLLQKRPRFLKQPLLGHYIGQRSQMVRIARRQSRGYPVVLHGLRKLARRKRLFSKLYGPTKRAGDAFTARILGRTGAIAPCGAMSGDRKTHPIDQSFQHFSQSDEQIALVGLENF